MTFGNVQDAIIFNILENLLTQNIFTDGFLISFALLALYGIVCNKWTTCVAAV